MRRKRLFGAVCALVLVIAGGVHAAAPESSGQARYLTMPDGVRIAVDIWLPARRTGRIPTLVRSTRYWRAAGLSDPTLGDSNAEEVWAVTDAGYALVLVDVRGTGASFGTWPYPWSRAEIADLGNVAKWIAGRPWSNGRVGSYGISYEGNTAELLGSIGERAVRAVAPRFDDYEPYTGIAYPGGLFTEGFVKTWNDANQLLDDNNARGLGLPPIVTGVKPVDGPRGRALLRQAVAQHGPNGDVYRLGKRVVYRDDPFGDSRIVQWSPATYVERLGQSGVAVQAWASWLDAGTADGALSRFASARNPQ
jgi:putative CocE/NonD family hydrolase